MRSAFIAAACAICAAAFLSAAPTEAATVRADAPARSLAIVKAQTSGATKIRKECEAKADKQNLKGLSHQAYVDRCIAALSFNTQYGTR